MSRKCPDYDHGAGLFPACINAPAWAVWQFARLHEERPGKIPKPIAMMATASSTLNATMSQKINGRRFLSITRP
jgi:hypothetical protein